MAETNTRQTNRSPVTLKIKFKSETLDQFIERYSIDISHGGIFIRTKDPLTVGTTLKFEFQLKDGASLIAGEGTVVWTREHNPKRTGVSPGMGVRFDKLPAESQRVLDQVLSQKDRKTAPVEEPEEEEPEGFGDDFVDTPTRVAPAALVDSLTRSDFADAEGDMTPLPQALPFHSDAHDFSDDAFSESTKVASLDEILAQSQDRDDDEYDEDAVFASTGPQASEAQGVQAKEDAPTADATAEYEDPFADLNAEKATDSDEGEAADEDPSDRAATEVLEKHDEFEPEPEPPEPEPEPEPQRVTAAVAEQVEHKSDTSTPWIAVAAIILLIGGAGGFWLLNKGDTDDSNDSSLSSSKTLSQNTTDTAGLVEPDNIDEAAIQDPVQEPVVAEPTSEPSVPTVSTSITTIPEGASLTFEGMGLDAIAPATFDLPEGKMVTLRVSHAEYSSQSIEFVVDGAEQTPIKLVAKPRVLRFVSTPPGASVFVNGQRLRGRTPVDLPFNNKIARRAKLNVQYRLPNYKLWSASMPTKEGFEAGDTVLVRTIDGALVAYPKRQTPAPTTKPPVAKSGDEKITEEPATGDAASKDEDVKEDGDTSEADVSDEGVKDEDVKDEAAKDGATKDEGAPTPDWMK